MPELTNSEINKGRKEYSNNFVSSLDSLTADDTAGTAAKTDSRKGISFGFLYRAIVVILCFCILAYCINELTVIVGDYQKGDDLYNDIENSYWGYINGSTGGNLTSMVIDASDVPMASYSQVLQFGPPIYTPTLPNAGGVSTNPLFQKRLAFIQDLKGQNSHTYGHIIIGNTKINYPVVQCKDNDYYLTHDFRGVKSAVGAIFIDCRNSTRIEYNKNTIVYGHNMLNQTMFHDVENYLNKDFFFDPANDIVITTFDGMYTFRVFSVYPTNAFDKYFKTQFDSSVEFLNFCREREAMSIYHRDDINFEWDDVLVTLSTCIMGQEDGRYAIHAKLIKIEK